MNLFRRKQPQIIPEDIQFFVVEQVSQIMKACIENEFERLLPFIAKRRHCSVDQLTQDAFDLEKENFLRYPMKHLIPTHDAWPKLLNIELFDRDVQLYHAEAFFYTDQHEPSDLSIRGEVLRQKDGSLSFEMIGIQVF